MRYLKTFGHKIHRRRWHDLINAWYGKATRLCSWPGTPPRTPKTSALLLNEGIPRALKGKKLRLKIPRVLPSIFKLILVLQIWGQNTIGGQYLQNINALIFWFKYLQKVNAMPSDFWWKNYKFCSIDAYFLILFFKGSKVIYQRGKKKIKNQKVWTTKLHSIQVKKI